MPALSSSSVPLIKGYLPVRLRIPSQPQMVRRGEDGEDETFFFIREHQGKSSNTDGETERRGTTLFVANAPVVPNVSTKLLLKSIFGRFAEVARVTAVQNPRAAASAAAGIETNDGRNTTTSALTWTENQSLFEPTFLPPILSSTEGKYAHVVFSSPKEMKKAKKALENLMAGMTGGKKSSRRRSGEQKCASNDRFLLVDKLELQTLSDESLRQWESSIRTAQDDEFDEDSQVTDRRESGVLAVAKRYRESCQLLKSRSRLMEECNVVMQAYEDAEEAKRLAQEAAKAQPDEDGFVTVSYSNAVGSKVDFEESATATTPSRRKGNKRTRKKKDPVGSGELKDFYRFQRADNRKRTMEDLRRKFEEDVRKVKRLKEEKEYRPF